MFSTYQPMRLLMMTTLAIACATSPQSSGLNTAAVAPMTPESRPTEVLLPLPSEADTKGSIQLLPMGRTYLQAESTESGELELLPALHLRMVVTNQVDTRTWTLDTRLQQITLGNTQGIRPTFTKNLTGEAPPFIRIDPGDIETIDLYYVIPIAERGPDADKEFSLSWQIAAGTHDVVDTTTFRALTEVPAPLSSPPPVRGPASEPWGPTLPTGIESDWWLDPFSDLPPSWRDFVY